MKTNNRRHRRHQWHHRPVLLHEVIEYLEVKRGKKYIDATLGFGGHAREILSKGGNLLGIDRDSENLAKVAESFDQFEQNNWKLVQGNFAKIKTIVKVAKFDRASGILLDLGISSWQLDESKRGFGHRISDSSEEKLDMRMDLDQEVTAEDVVNKYSEAELYYVISRYGELREAKRIAREIVKTRPMKTTADLVAAVSNVNRSGSTLARLFQALRIEVNQELEALKFGLEGALELLEKDGRLAVISFHSLEDRLVKQKFMSWERANKIEHVTRQPVTASKVELKENLRAKSAKLRVVRKK